MNESGTTSQTRDALTAFEQGLKSLLPATHLIAPTEVEKFSSGLEERVFRGSAPEPRILEQLAARIVEALERAPAVLPLSTVDWLDVPRILFAPWRGSPLIASMPVRRGLFQAVYRGPRVTCLVRLIDAYLRNFDPLYAEELRFLGAMILELLSITRRTSLSAATWWQRHQQTRLFFPAETPGRLAELVSHGGPAELAGTLEKVGLTGNLAGSGLSRAALLKYAGEVAAADDRKLAMIISWRSLFTPMTVEMDAALLPAALTPWASGQLPIAHREWLSGILRSHRSAGTQEQFFASLEPEFRLRLSAWTDAWPELAEHSMDRSPSALQSGIQRVADFFDLLEEHSGEDIDERQSTNWAEQRRFWWACATAGLIAESRIALGSNVVSHLGRKALQSRLRGKFARLRGFGSSHCALFLRFQRLIVMLDSHQVRCRFWRSNDPRAPVLSANVFYRSELLQRSPTDLHVVPDDPQTGVPCPSTDSSAWQRLICQFIREHSGEDLSTATRFPDASSATN